eukprot:1137340-Pelagomonas_calceolata.AAC.4
MEGTHGSSEPVSPFLSKFEPGKGLCPGFDACGSTVQTSGSACLLGFASINLVQNEKNGCARLRAFTLLPVAICHVQYTACVNPRLGHHFPPEDFFRTHLV